MKRLSILLVVGLFLGVGLNTLYAQEELKIAGTRHFYFGGLPDLTEAFTKKTGIKASAYAGGCGSASKGIAEDTLDIGVICCPLTEKEIGLGFVAVPVARFAVTVIINKDNPIESLTMAQGRDIFSGKITNWAKVGGENKPIALVTRLHCKNRLEIFRMKTVVDFENYAKEKMIVKSMDKMVDNVEKFPLAIGHVSLSKADSRRVKILKIDSVSPTSESITDGSYPIADYIYLVTKGKATGNDKKFIDFVLSGEGQEAVIKLRKLGKVK